MSDKKLKNMIKKILFLTVMVLFASACGAKSPADNYTLIGEIQGLPENATLILFPLSHSEEAPIAEGVVKDGKFKISGKVDHPTAVTMVVKDGYGSKKFMLEPGTISLKGKVIANPAKGDKTQYRFDGVAVEGSPMTKKFDSLLSGRNKIDSDMMALQRKYANIHNIMSAPGQTRETIDSLRNTAEFKEMSTEEHKIFQALNDNFNTVVSENKDSFWGPLMMIALVTYLSPDNRPMYESLSPEAKGSDYGKKVYQELYPLGETGAKVKNFSGVTPAGEKVSLDEICKKNKYVLIDFWASWCRPCRASIPGLKKIYEAHGGKGFEIVGVSIDKDQAAWMKAINKEAMPWTNIRDVKGTIANDYHVSAVPTMFIIDSKGQLVAENLHGEELAKKIDELMAK